MVDKIEKGKMYNCTKTLMTNEGSSKGVKKVYFIKDHAYKAIEDGILQGEVGLLFAVQSEYERSCFELVPNYE